jgi:NAD(P)-dependent dehydrogenase (short-subunit alcohol dehydrogenase family)
VIGRVAGKVVVVTGAAQGQGAAEVRLLAAEGVKAIGVDLVESPTEDLPGVEYRQLDVTDEAAWTALAASLSSGYGQVNGLVANAGITWRARLAELAPADLTRVMDVNVTGALLGIQALTPLMPAGASIVCVGSVAGLTGHFPAAYTASKWALRGLAKVACPELGGRGIRVNTVHPGYIETPMTASAALPSAPPTWRRHRWAALAPRRRSRRWWPSCSATTPRSSPVRRLPSTEA